jgi:phage baseplate assembly protein W
MADVPHFDLPFRFGSDGHAAVVEQDTFEEIRNCVVAIVRTVVGQREEMPEFGVPDLTFELQPLHIEKITEAILRDEPRASVLLEQHPDLIEKTIADISVQVSQAGGRVSE